MAKQLSDLELDAVKEARAEEIEIQSELDAQQYYEFYNRKNVRRTTID